MKEGVCEMHKARSIISHNILRAREVGSPVAVAVKTLMVTGNLTQVGSRSRG